MKGLFYISVKREKKKKTMKELQVVESYVFDVGSAFDFTLLLWF